MRVLITGGSGQLAADIKGAFARETVVSLSRLELDITDVAQVRRMLHAFQPTVVINTAAFHEVDRCESEPELAFAVNAVGPQLLARTCKDLGALLVHISTDYVFAGDSDTPYRETHRVHPISVYGASKASGEMTIRATTDAQVIIRTTGLYGIEGGKTAHGNFVETMLRLAAQGGEINVVCDQVLTPSYTQDVAGAVKTIVDRGGLGTFHVTNSGSCSWYQFACAIFRLANLEVEVHPVTQRARPYPARRPAYSVLAHDAMRALKLPELRSWQDALTAYFQQRGAMNANVEGR